MNIVVYGYDSCPFTVKLKEEMDSNNVKYEYRPIDTNEKYEQEYNKLNQSGVPITLNKNNNKLFIGYGKIEEIFKKIK